MPVSLSISSMEWSATAGIRLTIAPWQALLQPAPHSVAPPSCRLQLLLQIVFFEPVEDNYLDA